MHLIEKILPKSGPFTLGLFISFLGALPLGYINVISLQILLKQGSWATLSFISGIIFVEYFVLKATSYGAKWLVQQKKLLLFIDVFTILFFVVLAYYFYSNLETETNFSLTLLEMAQYPFILGVTLNCLNFIQWPYWSGIYIYMFRTKKIKDLCHDNSLFIIGAMLGTLAGMTLFAYTSKYLLIENDIQINKYLNLIFAILFLVLSLGLLIKVVLKYKRKSSSKLKPTN